MDSDNELSPITIKILQQQKLFLSPIKEDLAQWLSNLLDRSISAEELLESLQTGSLLCEMADILCDKMRKYVESLSEISLNNIKEFHTKIPNPPKYRPQAMPKSFFARDNAANFLEWCKKLGVEKSCMFESEDLVLLNKPRNVLLCLLDVARIASRQGVDPPELIRLEREIEEEEKECEMFKQQMHINEDTSVVLPPSISRRKRKKALILDDAVHTIVDNPPFNGLVDLVRVSEGRYKIEGKTVFVRMLRQRHVMVRVGGGWDTLHHYLVTHDSGRYTSFAQFHNQERFNTPSRGVKTPLRTIITPQSEAPLSSRRLPGSARSKVTPGSRHGSRYTGKRKLLASVQSDSGEIVKIPVNVKCKPNFT